MKILWLDNFTPEEYRGGAELTGYYLRKQAEKEGHTVQLVTSSMATPTTAGHGFDLTVLGNVDRFPKEMLQRLVISEMPYVIIHNNSLDIPEPVPNLYLNAKVVVTLEPNHHKRITLPISCHTVYAPYVDTSLFYNYSLVRNNRACYIGLITEHKGILQTIKECQERNIPLDLYGKTDNPNFLSKVKAMEGVKYCGEINTPEDVATVLNAYTYFAWILGRYGCYGRSMVEALLCGCKIITYREDFGLFNYDWDFDSPEDIKKHLEEHLANFWGSLEDFLKANYNFEIKE